jgi:predicted DNA-binding transcriptional regulator AlpA
MATVVPIRAPRGKLLTIAEVCQELQIALSTFYDWRTKGTGPRCIKLPNGKVRVRHTDLEKWLNALEEAA